MNRHKTWIYLMPGTNEDIVAGQIGIESKVDAVIKKIKIPDTTKNNKAGAVILPAEPYINTLKREYSELQEKNKEFEEQILALNKKIAAKQTAINDLLPDNRTHQLIKVRYEADLNQLNKQKQILEKKYLDANEQFDRQLNSETFRKNFAPRENLVVNAYKPNPAVMKNVRVEVLQGVGAPNISPMQMDSRGRISKIKLPTVAIGTATGWGEKQNIAFCMRQLAEADPLPERIVLSGFSRGSVACIELARAIYMQYGEKIKIAINIHDPVPGPGRHTKTKMVIPPNVDSLVITYAKKENNPILKPLDMRQIYFDPTKTTVTTTGFDTEHDFSTNQIECFGSMENINSSMLAALNNRNPGIVGVVPYINPQDENFSQARKNCVFHLSTNPDLNANLPAELKQFHKNLQAEVDLDKKSQVRGSARNMVTRATRSIVEDERSPEKQQRSRKLKLKVIRHISRRAIAMDQKKQADAYLAWHNNVDLDPTVLKTEFLRAANKLKSQINNIVASKNGHLNDHDARRVDVLDYVSRSLMMLANDLEGKSPETINYPEIYQILDNLKYFVQTQQPNLSGRIEAGINRGLRFFKLPMIKSEPYQMAMECLNSVLEPRKEVTYVPANK